MTGDQSRALKVGDRTVCGALAYFGLDTISGHEKKVMRDLNQRKLPSHAMVVIRRRPFDLHG